MARSNSGNFLNSNISNSEIEIPKSEIPLIPLHFIKHRLQRYQ